MSKSPGERPELGWIRKDLLIVDERYQRNTTSRRSQNVIDTVAKEFQWSCFQTPTVTPNQDGKYLVIDGQHRIEAARLRGDIEEIPCYIVKGLDLKQQAANFVTINNNRTRLHPLAIHRALVAMGDKQALKINEVCEEAGVRIANSPAQYGMTAPDETAALGSIKQMIKVVGEANVIAALMVIADSFKINHGMMRSRAIKVLSRFFHLKDIAKVDRDVLIRLMKKRNSVELENAASLAVLKDGGKVDDVMLKILTADYDKACNVHR